MFETFILALARRLRLTRVFWASALVLPSAARPRVLLALNINFIRNNVDMDREDDCRDEG